MSAEGGELTFVRCPSCRSLVPAVSTRCRWCGNSLGGGNSSEGPKEETTSRRVRQKTRSIQAGEYVPQPTREKGSQGVEEGPQEEDYELDDPLKGFIEEVEEEISDEEILSSLAEVEEESKKGVVNGSVNDITHSEESSIASPEPSENEFGDLYEDAEMEIDSEVELEIPVTKHRNGLERVEESLDAVDEVVEAPSVNIDLSNEAKKTVQAKPQPQRLSSQGTVAPSRHIDNRGELESTFGLSKGALSADRQPLEEPKLGGKMNKTHYEATSGGKLFGWLVSYSTAEGVAFELREGRFFISGSTLKGNDFVIKDPSVSTPHAMVNVSRGGGFAIQDLMSDRGIFIRRKGQDTYQREDGIAKCLNGDWIRIGDVEYLLTVVADLGK